MSPKALPALDAGVKAFLVQHHIPRKEVFNATGLTPAEYKVQMKASGNVVAVGVRPCPHGHVLRTRHNKCVICHPETLSYARRHHEPAEVYLAHSRAGRLFKVGITNHRADRFEQLNGHGIGGHCDWVLLATRTCAEAGQVEHHIHTLLAPYAVREGHRSRSGVSRELFRCSERVVLEAFRQATVAEHPKARKADLIESLPLSARVRRSLARAGVRTLGNLLSFTKAELRRNENFTVNGVREVLVYLAMEGRSLAEA